MELRGDGAQAHQRHAFLRRQFHRTAGAQSYHCVSPPLISLSLGSNPRMHGGVSVFVVNMRTRSFRKLWL